MLTETQLKLQDEIIDFIIKPTKGLKPVERTFLLKGYAGTGKTFSICKILSDLASASEISARPTIYKSDVRFCAPTNKARKVLGEGINGAFKAETLHLLLKCSPNINEHGERSFGTETYSKDPIPFEKFHILVIDECSMISKGLYRSLHSLLVVRPNLKIIYMGDPCQLPPVNEIASLTFDRPTDFELTEIIRNKGALQSVCNYIRDRQNDDVRFGPWIDSISKDKSITNKEAVVFTDDEQLWKDTIFQAFKTVPDTHVLSWTNRRTNQLNGEIRDELYGENAKDLYCVGERIIANGFFHSWTYDDNNELQRNNKCYTCDQYIVTEIVKDLTVMYRIQDYSDEESEKGVGSIGGRMIKIMGIDESQISSPTTIGGKYTIGKETFIKVWRMYLKDVSHVNLDDKIETIVMEDTAKSISNRTFINIHAPDDENNRMYNAIFDKIVKDAKESTARYKRTREYSARIDAKDAWKQVYAFKEFFAPEIGYDYSTTVHKSQGSTYKLVFVDLQDICKNRDILYRNQCIYTAFSRPSTRLIVYN
jgi:hypothetical protein